MLNVVHSVEQSLSTQALESLSSPNPSTQLPRLKALYTDLLDTLSPLFPSQHPVIQSLSFPFPPTSSPLHSALALLKEILTALRQRCAPVRDADIDALLAKIDEPLPPLSYVHGTSQAQLATLVIDVFRSLITLANTLKSDLTHSVLGAMSEAQLATVIAQQTRAREREVVLEMWDGKENVRALWGKWVSPEERVRDSLGEERETKQRKRKTWVAKLIKTLALPVPVSCDVPPSLATQTSTQTASSDSPGLSGTEHPPTELPPQFFFTAPALFYLQNFLQALVVAGSLRSLTRMPQSSPVSSPGAEHPPGSDFMSRVWTLLKAEIDRDEFAIGVGATSGSQEEEEDSTKIINLADEVIRARRLSSDTVAEQEEMSLREAVERTLRPRDPVFLLLLERVVRAVEEGIVGWIDGTLAEDMAVRHAIPEKMRAGREIRSHQSHDVRHIVDREYDKKGMEIPKPGPSMLVKGFEDPVLAKGIEQSVMGLIRCVQWTEEVWGDLI